VKVASIAEAKAKLSDYVERCRRETVVFTKHGHPRAALVPLENDDDLERFLLSRNARFLRLLARSERSGRVSLAEADRLLAAVGPAKGRRALPTRGRSVKRSR
jgi:prevent-host-death family protein